MARATTRWQVECACPEIFSRRSPSLSVPLLSLLSPFFARPLCVLLPRAGLLLPRAAPSSLCPSSAYPPSARPPSAPPITRDDVHRLRSSEPRLRADLGFCGVLGLDAGAPSQGFWG